MILKQSCLKDTLHHLQNGKLQICFRYEALHFSILIYLLDSWNLSSKTSGKTLEFPEHQSSREPFKATELCSADRFPPFCGYCIFLDGLPLWLSGKELACWCERHGFLPGLGSSPGEGNSNSLQYYCLQNFMDRGACGLQSMGLQRIRHNLVTKQQQ